MALCQNDCVRRQCERPTLTKYDSVRGKEPFTLENDYISHATRNLRIALRSARGIEPVKPVYRARDSLSTLWCCRGQKASYQVSGSMAYIIVLQSEGFFPSYTPPSSNSETCRRYCLSTLTIPSSFLDVGSGFFSYPSHFYANRTTQHRELSTPTFARPPQ